MAIRIRKVGNITIALCAAHSIAHPGDIYLDDTIHHALTNKFTRDFQEEGFLSTDFNPEDTDLVKLEERY